MKNLIFIFSNVAIITFLTNSCDNTSKSHNEISKEEYRKIEYAITNSIACIKNKDTTLLYSIIADDKNYLEVHPENKVVKGIKQFKEAERVWLDPRFKNI